MPCSVSFLFASNVNIPKGELTVVASKTDAGIRTVDLTPALRDELALWRDKSRFTEPNDLVFPTLRGLEDNRQNVRVGTVVMTNGTLLMLMPHPL